METTPSRTERSPAVAKAGLPALEPYLRAAQRSLPQVQMRAVKQVATLHGLAGVRVDVDFVPPGMNERYRRVHAVLVDGRPHDGRGGWDPYRDWDAGTG